MVFLSLKLPSSRIFIDFHHKIVYNLPSFQCVESKCQWKDPGCSFEYCFFEGPSRLTIFQHVQYEKHVLLSDTFLYGFGGFSGAFDKSMPCRR